MTVTHCSKLIAACALPLIMAGCGDAPIDDPPTGVPQGTPNPNPSAAPAGHTTYFYATSNLSGSPIAKAFHSFDPVALSGGAYYVAVTFSVEFVDNTYGANSSSGYRKDKEHNFRDLVGSDHVIVGFEDPDGNLLYEIKLDYLAEDDTMGSGYSSGGVWDGDGKMLLGPDDLVLDATSSLDRNLNERGCVYLEDSPAENDPACPDWDRLVTYEVWLSAEHFEDTGFGRPVLDHVHASPSRTDSTVPVTPGEPPAGCVPEIDGQTCTPPTVEEPPAGGDPPPGDGPDDPIVG